eukprot:CAMPEP_0185724676 /NCGR_PEP_ID=MMETSP1171-20130828/1088_1 /TAXON_ID=374046 /ORGANISM="Helicotheca tamensis, Strain CCMP826" /LENGTH=210 /DNA_ID=CAMNT_0028392583 /DNA_START=104 /DNA_END=736 /DNA_ORIENTATION=-
MSAFDASRIEGMIPEPVSLYVHTNMDTIPKKINHVLLVMFACNIALLLSSFSTMSLPNIGFNSFLVAIFSSAQTVVIWAAFNGRMAQRFSFLTKSPFALGTHFGITIGMAVVMSVLYRYFGQLSKCVEADVPSDLPLPQYACESKGAMTSYWFFAILLHWLNVLLAFLIFKGKDELMQDMEGNYQYEEIGSSGQINMQSFAGDFPPVQTA